MKGIIETRIKKHKFRQKGVKMFTEEWQKYQHTIYELERVLDISPGQKNIDQMINFIETVESQLSDAEKCRNLNIFELALLQESKKILNNISVGDLERS